MSNQERQPRSNEKQSPTLTHEQLSKYLADLAAFEQEFVKNTSRRVMQRPNGASILVLPGLRRMKK